MLDFKPEFTFGILQLDKEAHYCTVDGIEVFLTKQQMELCHLLLSTRPRLKSRDEILNTIWGYSDKVDLRAVDAAIKRTRKSLGPAGRYIECIRNIGYRWISHPAGNLEM